MPASITWIVRMRKTHGEGAKTIARAPAPLADQMIERGMENGRIDSILEWLLPVSRKSNDRLGSGCGVIGITRQVPPHDGAAFIGEVKGEGAVDPDKTLLNELPNLRVAQRARRFEFMGRHEILISLCRQSLPADGGRRRFSV
jgi:hypothetical protein